MFALSDAALLEFRMTLGSVARSMKPISRSSNFSCPESFRLAVIDETPRVVKIGPRLTLCVAASRPHDRTICWGDSEAITFSFGFGIAG